MFLFKSALLALIATTLLSSFSEARRNSDRYQGGGKEQCKIFNQRQGKTPTPLDSEPSSLASKSSQLIDAMEARCRVKYIETGVLEVTKLLPDDNSGLKHQKWEAILVNPENPGKEFHVTVVYNSEMGERVPVRIGDRFSAGGELIPTGNSSLIHWLHEDPRKNRPDGYIQHDGTVYGDSDPESSARF